MSSKSDRISNSDKRALGNSNKWKVLFTGALANTCFTFVIGGVPAASIILRDDYNIQTAMLGLLMGIVGFGIAISEIPWGIATDRFGDRPILIIGLSTTAIALFVLAFFTQASSNSSTSVVLCVGLLAVGLLGSSVNGSSGRAIMQWFKPEERGLAMSIRQTAVPLGYALGAILYPYISLHFGFSTALFISAIVCALATLFSYLWIVDPVDTGETNSADISDAEKRHEDIPIKPLKSFRVWRIVAAVGILCAPQFALMTFSMLFLHDFAGLGIGFISIILFLIQMSSIPTRIGSGIYTDKKGNRKAFLKAVTALSFILFVALTVLTYFSYQFDAHHFAYLLSFILLACGVVVSAWHGVGYTEIATAAGQNSVATALAMANAVVFFILFATPTVIPWVLNQFTWVGVWVVMSVICAIAYFLFEKPNPDITGNGE